MMKLTRPIIQKKTPIFNGLKLIRYPLIIIGIAVISIINDSRLIEDFTQQIISKTNVTKNEIQIAMNILSVNVTCYCFLPSFNPLILDHTLPMIGNTLHGNQGLPNSH
jgi:hypothetical protein